MSKDLDTLPNFVVLGQVSSATSLIYRVLKRNPLIALSKRKELHFFSKHFNKGLDWYAQHFTGLTPQTNIVGEVSSTYLRLDSIHRIAETLGPQTKIIFVMRRPLEHAYAQYLEDISANQSPGTFLDTEHHLLSQLQSLQESIRAVYDLFGPTNVLPLFFEQDVACQIPTFEPQILHFLGLPNTHTKKPRNKRAAVNAELLPRYIFSAQDELCIHLDAKQFIIPPRHLVFCAGKRSSWIKENPATDDILDAFYRQSSWTTAISRTEYEQAQKRIILPSADALEQEFDFDLSHWRCEPRRIAHDLAPPPLSLLKQPAENAS